MKFRGIAYQDPVCYVTINPVTRSYNLVVTIKVLNSFALIEKAKIKYIIKLKKKNKKILNKL